MQSAICQELLKEDTFNLFRYELRDFMNNDDSKTLKDVKLQIKSYFTKKILACKDDNLIYFESIRMIMLLDSIVDKFDAVYNDHTEDDNDEIMKIYCDNLNAFIANVNDEDVINYADFISK